MQLICMMTLELLAIARVRPRFCMLSFRSSLPQTTDFTLDSNIFSSSSRSIKLEPLICFKREGRSAG